MSNLQIWRENYTKLTIPYYTKVLKNTLLYCFCIVKYNLTARIPIFTRHINIKKLFQSATVILDFKQPGKNLNSCF